MTHFIYYSKVALLAFLTMQSSYVELQFLIIIVMVFHMLFVIMQKRRVALSLFVMQNKSDLACMLCVWMNWTVHFVNGKAL